jgi:hypothetical protein
MYRSVIMVTPTLAGQSLRLQMMRTGDPNWRDRFEGCLASYNNSN